MKCFSRQIAGIALALGTAFATAQTSPTTTPTPNIVNPVQQGQSAAQSKAGRRSSEKMASWPEDLIYKSFFSFMTEDHWRVQQEIRDAKPGSKPIVEGLNWQQSMGITADEDQIILIYVLQADARIKENDREYFAALRQFQAQNGGPFEAAKLQPPPVLLALIKEENELIFGTVANPKKALGDESFAKLDKYIRKYFGGGHIFQTQSAVSPHSSDQP